MNRAAVSIPEKLFFKIGEVCDITGVQAHVLRYWESEFPMLAPQKNRAGQRTYRKRDVEMVLRIKDLLYEDQYTIAGAKKKLLSDIRGASKLKVVTPEMSAAAVAEAQNVAPQPIASPAPSAPSNTVAPPVSSTRTNQEEKSATETRALTSNERRAALHRLRQQLNELLTLLGSTDVGRETRRK